MTSGIESLWDAGSRDVEMHISLGRNMFSLPLMVFPMVISRLICQACCRNALHACKFPTSAISISNLICKGAAKILIELLVKLVTSTVFVSSCSGKITVLRHGHDKCCKGIGWKASAVWMQSRVLHLRRHVKNEITNVSTDYTIKHIDNRQSLTCIQNIIE